MSKFVCQAVFSTFVSYISYIVQFIVWGSLGKKSLRHLQELIGVYIDISTSDFSHHASESLEVEWQH